MNRQLAWRVGRILGKVEQYIWTVPFKAEAIRVCLGGLKVELERGFGEHEEMKEIIDGMRELLEKDEINKERVRKGYFKLVTKSEEKVEG